MIRCERGIDGLGDKKEPLSLSSSGKICSVLSMLMPSSWGKIDIRFFSKDCLSRIAGAYLLLKAKKLCSFVKMRILNRLFLSMLCIFANLLRRDDIVKEPLCRFAISRAAVLGVVLVYYTIFYASKIIC